MRFNGSSVVFLFASAALAAALLVFMAVPADATQSPTLYKVAPYCCVGCQYESGCCCGKRNKLPVTVSKYARTITQTIRRTVTATKKAGRLRAREAWNQDQTEAFFESTEDEYLFDPSEDTAGSAHVLFARHLCPVCPQDAAVAAVGGSKNNNLNANSYKYCCPARKTITKTMKKTLTKRRTVTVIKTPASGAKIVGQVYYDLNKNGFYDIGIDKPIANTLILLVKGVKARAAQSVLGSTTSDSQGNFVILFNVQNPGITLNVVKESERFVPLLQFVTNAQGGGDVNVPVLRPVQPAVTSPSTVIANKAQVSGTGLSGSLIYIYSGSTRLGSGVVASDGTFTVKATQAVHSGKRSFYITQADKSNAESDAVQAGSVEITAAPIVSSTNFSGNVVTVTGTGVAGCVVELMADGSVVGKTVVLSNGTYSVVSGALDIGTYSLKVIELDADENSSDEAAASPIQVKVPAPDSPVVKSTTLTGDLATVTGTGSVGASINLFSDGFLVASALVGGDGKFTLVSSALAPGVHALSVSQTVQTATSASVSAGSVTVASLQESTTVPAGIATTAPSGQATTAPAGVKSTTEQGRSTTPALVTSSNTQTATTSESLSSTTLTTSLTSETQTTSESETTTSFTETSTTSITTSESKTMTETQSSTSLTMTTTASVTQTQTTSISLTPTTSFTATTTKVEPWSVDTVAGTDTSGNCNGGTGTTDVSFYLIRSLVTCGTSGWMFFADTYCEVLGMFHPGNTSVVFLTNSNGIGWYPKALTCDTTNNVLYLMTKDSTGHGNVLRKMNMATFQFTVLAGDRTALGTQADGTGTNAKFQNVEDIFFDGYTGRVWITDMDTVRGMNTGDNSVVTYYGQHGAYSSADGVGTNAQFNEVGGITGIVGSGSTATVLYVNDASGYNIRKIDVGTGQVSVFVGNLNGDSGNVDGVGTNAKLNGAVKSLKYEPIRNGIYAMQSNNGRLLRFIDLDPSFLGRTTIIAGSESGSQHVDGPNPSNQFWTGDCVTPSPTNSSEVYICDSYWLRKAFLTPLP